MFYYYLEIRKHSIEQLAAGMLTFIKQNLRVERYGLYQSIARNLGFSRIGENIYSHLDNALSMINGLVDIDGDYISLKDAVIESTRK